MDAQSTIRTVVAAEPAALVAMRPSAEAAASHSAAVVGLALQLPCVAIVYDELHATALPLLNVPGEQARHEASRVGTGLYVPAGHLRAGCEGGRTSARWACCAREDATGSSMLGTWSSAV